MKIPIPTQRLLNDRTFYIEFQGYLSNHGKHAIVALDKLHAKPERIQQYWDMYTTKTPYNLELDKVPTPWNEVTAISSDSEWRSLRGRKQKWQEMCLFLEQEKDNRFGGSMEQLVQEYAPSLVTSGIVGALTHGIIHMGWGIDANNDWMTIEGLAYLNYCHVGIDETKFQEQEQEQEPEEEGGDTTTIASSPMMKSMLGIANEWKANHLKETWIESVKAKYGEEFHPELVVAGFQWQLAKVLKEPHPVATNLPAWLTKDPLNKVWENLYKLCTYVYLATRDPNDNHGNFVVLHSLTSLWALEKVCRVIDDPTITRKALYQFYGSLICLLAASNSGFPPEEALLQAQTEFPMTKVDSLAEHDWTDTVQAACQEIEEHNIKLAYVARELWTRYDQWNGFSEAGRTFTLTPNIGPAVVEFKA